MAEQSVQASRISRYHFPFGIPAFEQLTSFRLVENPSWAPLAMLESESDPPVGFACAPVHLLMHGYKLELSEEEKQALGGADEAGGLILLAILTFRADAPPTANLLAPVVLNPAAGVGVQSVQPNLSYSPVHPIRREPPCS